VPGAADSCKKAHFVVHVEGRAPSVRSEVTEHFDLVPFLDQFTDLPISYRYLGSLIWTMTLNTWDVWLELRSRSHPLSNTATAST